jgi:hypothetical protein
VPPGKDAESPNSSAIYPDLAVRLTPLLMRDARRRQARFKKKVEAGEWPPKGS